MFDILTYVAGFAFDETLKTVVLIEKQKPAWQKGKLNGVGGKVEATDTSIEHAMEREFEEETSVKIDRHRWKKFATLNGPTWRVKFLVVKINNQELGNLKTTTDEAVWLRRLEFLQRTDNRELMINNIPWLTQMAYNALTGIENKQLTITESLF